MRFLGDVEDVREAQDDLAPLLVEVLAALLDEEEVGPSWPDLALTGPTLVAELAIRQPEREKLILVKVRTGTGVGRLIAARMIGVPDPDPEDLLDVVAELGNIIAGNIKVLVGHDWQLSLPRSRALDAPDEVPATALQVGATVLGHPVDMVVQHLPAADLDPELCWPGTTDDRLLETR